MNEHDRRLVADIIVGYYSRETFQNSELLAKRYGLAPPAPTSSAPTAALITTNDSDRPENSNSDYARHVEAYEAWDSVEPYPVANASLEHQPTLPLLTPTTADGIENNLESGVVQGTTGVGPLAELRRRRRRERREAHQDTLRRKAEERESERRRLQVEEERRAREVERAVFEAESAERARLVREAEDADNAASLVKRLFHTLQGRATASAAADGTVIGGDATINGNSLIGQQEQQNRL